MKARNCLALGTALVLAACGGGGGTEVATAPPPAPPAPPPPPPPLPPPSPPPIAPAHIGLVSAQRFAVLGIGNTYQMDGSGQHPSLLTGPTAQDVSFRYDVSSNTYQITLPGFNEGTLVKTAYNGSSGQPATSSTSQVEEHSFGFVLPLFVTLPVPGSNLSPYTYTSFAWWDGQTGTSSTGDVLRSDGIFAYGIPTRAGDVPVVGSAGYTAEIRGNLGPITDLSVSGDVKLMFDFAGGTLRGSMHPMFVDGLAGIVIDFGQFDFAQTVYSSGSTTFSGRFVVPGMPNANSSFEGNFTGPQAAELMARFQTPFVNGGQQGVMSGIWIGKKDGN
jgi:hypothetical protein